MTELILHRDTANAVALPLPGARTPIKIRLATADDLPFIDALQKQHTKMVGFFPRAWFENNVAVGNVIIAEDEATRERVGYCVYKDRYLKREELGIVYQLIVSPGKQRGLIGASLVKAAFERCPYGVKLFCCWCAQDIEANHFWESLGFVPLAFRTGSRKAGQKKEPRIHIFWQRRIREGDNETPYWFPSETSGGAMRENRLVLPIPPGTHWSDAKPAVLPGFDAKLLECHSRESGNPESETGSPHARGRRKKKEAPLPGAQKPRHGLWFALPAPAPPTKEELKAAKEAEKAAKRAQRQKLRNDPKLVEAARELRDKYIEQVNAGLLLPPSACGKYDVSRTLEAMPSAMKIEANPLLEAA